MIASRPMIACIKLVESTTAAQIPARGHATAAVTYPTTAPVPIVASAEGSRSENVPTPNIFAKSAATQKYSGGCTNHWAPFKCITTQSCVSRISRATSPYAVSLLSHSVPVPSPGSVASAATAAPMSAACHGRRNGCALDSGAARRGARTVLVTVYPIVMNVQGRLAVVVGGGSVAERKVAALLEAGATVRVVSPELAPALEHLRGRGQITWEARRFEATLLDGATLAFAATNDDAVNAAVVAAARQRSILVNDASKAERGDFATPAVYRKGELTISVDTGGTAPAVSKLVREKLGGLIERTLDNTLVCASRASVLAMTQTRTVMAKLARSGVASTVINISTKGDEVQDRSLASIGTDSVFVKELEFALREGRADYAVHSCKDLPSTLPDDMELTAVVERADPRDVYCSEKYASFEELPPNARVGTSSPRRRAQLEAMRGDLDYRDIRGNVDTRLRKLREGQYDAIVLAAAGLDRLGARATHMVPFAADTLVPAVAQGALAVETRRGDPVGAVLRTALNDPEREREVIAERAFLRGMRGGCQAPIGAHATSEGAGGSMVLRAAVGLGAAGVVRGERRAAVASAADAEALGTALAAELSTSMLERTR